MAEQQNEQQSKDFASWKPGSESAEAKNVGGKGDFGTPVGAGPDRERDYVNENTKRADPGATQPMDWEHDGKRDHGVGAADSGPGSASAGDLDPDFVGIAGSGGIAASGTVGRPPGPDDSDGTSNEFAAGRPAQGRNQTGVGKVGGSKRVPGDVQTRGLDQHTNEGEGADDVTNAQARGDDSFAAEVSSGEARGEDNSPADGTDELG
ncbi:MAG TPA: hypothetical protein VGR35_17195 [Tepidisphaeraceae bacterium]|nr:hypothetical protein [Tepidisphaeraceae bacterium]